MLKSRITTIVLLFVAVVAATSDLRAAREGRGSQRQPDSGGAVSESGRPPPADCRQEVMPAKPRQCPNTEMATYNVCAGREPEFLSCQ